MTYDYKYAIKHTRDEDLTTEKHLKIAIVTYHSQVDQQKDVSVGHREAIKAIKAVYSSPFMRLCGLCRGRNLNEGEEIVAEAEVSSDSLDDVDTKRTGYDMGMPGVFCPPTREESSCDEVEPGSPHPE